MRRRPGIVTASIVAALLTHTLVAAAQADAPVAAPAPAPSAAPSDVPPTVAVEAPPEAPPPPPRKKGVVIESRVGALLFLGDFRHLAPDAPWFHVDVGYEFAKWFGVFAYGELTFTDTSGMETAANVIAFPIYGFGGGPRFTVHVTPRVALFLEGDVGAMRADVPQGALADLGFANAEKLGISFGGRLGVEWYQIDRHLAFGLDVGMRDATGFAEQFIGSSPPLMLDASAAIRYTF